MAAGTILGLDTVGIGAAWVGRFGRAGRYHLDSSGALVSSLPAPITSLNLAVIGSGSVVYGTNVNIQFDYSDGSTTYYFIDNRFSNRNAYGLRLSLETSAPILLSVFMMSNTASRPVKIGLWDNDSATKTQEITPPEDYRGGMWVRAAINGKVGVTIENVNSGSSNSALFSALLFDPWPQGFASAHQGFVGHGVF